jgi:hypothetical protein
MAHSISAPVVLIIFRRPDTTRRVFEAIRKAQPEKLFIVADGPRDDQPDEKEKCQAARDIVANSNIDWDCEVYRDYADENMGCKRRVVSGLNWVFESVDRAIILEDDCVPNKSFFRFQESMLDYYFDDKRIMHIAGSNMGVTGSMPNDSYFFSRQTFIWGWGTWAGAWKHYDMQIKKWKILRNRGKLWSDILVNNKEFRVRRRMWDRVYNGKIDTWDYQWLFAMLTNGGLSVVPNSNLVSNIGFGDGALHTKDVDNPMSNRPKQDLSIPLSHPEVMIRDTVADHQYVKSMHSGSWVGRIATKIFG